MNVYLEKLQRLGTPVASMSSYNKQLAAVKKAASLAARLCQKVQRALLQSDVQSKSDKSPVTVADYGRGEEKQPLERLFSNLNQTTLQREPGLWQL